MLPSRTGESTPKRPYGGRLVVTYSLLALAFVGGIFAVEQGLSERYGPNVVTELFGILATVVVVERLLTWQRHRSATPVREVALRRLWRQLNRLSHMLLFAYKAAAPSESPEPVSLNGVLLAWQREGRFLDFRRPYGPDGPPRSWHHYAAEVAGDFEAGIHDIIDRYLAVLGSEVPAAAEDLIDHPVFQILKHGPAIERLDREHGFDLPRLSFLVQSVDDPAADSLEEFAALLKKLHEAYRGLGGQPLSLDARLYEDHISPAWESARVRQEDLDRAVQTSAGPTPPPA